MAASLVLLAAIGIREIVLGLTASAKGIPVKRVTLFVFGGLSQVTRDATLPIIERLLAVVGLISNLAIAAACYAVLIGLAGTGDIILASLIQWLSFILILLAVFHFIPGFPLDGGRFLRALLWSGTGDYGRATRIAGWIGRGTALLFVVGGLLVLAIVRQWSFGAVLLVAGWALYSAAAQSQRETRLLEGLRDITAQDIMTREYALVSRQIKLDILVRDHIVTTGQRFFVVADNDKMDGIVTIQNIKRIPRQRWQSTVVGEIMTPADKVKTAYPQQPVVSVLEQMEDLGIEQMLVLAGEEVVGVIIRDSLVRLVNVRTELKT